MKNTIILSFLIFSMTYCSQKQEQKESKEPSAIQMRVDDYKPVKLTADLSQLSATEKQMIPLMIEVAQIMDELFWFF